MGISWLHSLIIHHFLLLLLYKFLKHVSPNKVLQNKLRCACAFSETQRLSVGRGPNGQRFRKIKMLNVIVLQKIIEDD